MAASVPNYVSILIISACFIAVVLIWLRVYRISRLLDVPNNKKKSIAITAAFLLGGWPILVLTLSALGFFTSRTKYFPNSVFGFFGPVIIGCALAYYSSTTRKVIDEFRQPVLIGAQLIRVIGSVFLIAGSQNSLPWIFAIPTAYGDLLVGLSAPLVAYFYVKQKPWSRKLAISWNIIGLLDFAVAFAISMLSAPGPLQMIFPATSTESLRVLPLVMFPVFLVPLSILLHLCSLRLLFKSQGKNTRKF